MADDAALTDGDRERFRQLESIVANIDSDEEASGPIISFFRSLNKGMHDTLLQSHAMGAPDAPAARTRRKRAQSVSMSDLGLHDTDFAFALEAARNMGMQHATLSKPASCSIS
jgi:hypothetical protein